MQSGSYYSKARQHWDRDHLIQSEFAQMIGLSSFGEYGAFYCYILK